MLEIKYIFLKWSLDSPLHVCKAATLLTHFKNKWIHQAFKKYYTRQYDTVVIFGRLKSTTYSLYKSLISYYNYVTTCN